MKNIAVLFEHLDKDSMQTWNTIRLDEYIMSAAK